MRSSLSEIEIPEKIFDNDPFGQSHNSDGQYFYTHATFNPTGEYLYSWLSGYTDVARVWKISAPSGANDYNFPRRYHSVSFGSI